MKKYSLWGLSGHQPTQLVLGDEEDQLLNPFCRLDPDFVCIKVFEAASWEEANRIFHEFNGWEPYKEMDP